MASQLDIANRALLSIGARAQISSLNPSDGSTEGDAVSTLWTSTFEELGRAAHWNCLRAQVTLSLLCAAQGTPENPTGTVLPLPPPPWLYAYAYPSNCLDVRYILPNLQTDALGSVPATTFNNSIGPWAPGGEQIVYAVSTIPDPITTTPRLAILTNQSQAQVVYTLNQPNPATWDSMFQSAMVASLGAFLVPALSLNIAMLDRSVKMAEIVIARARTADGNEGVAVMDHVPDWITARLGGQGYGIGYNITAYGSVVNMNWPVGGGQYGD